MSIVEFAEDILGYKLLSFQKEFLTKCDEAYASNKQLYYIPHRGCNIKRKIIMNTVLTAERR